MLTSYGDKSITYDAIGNPLNDGSWAYTWEHGRQLASMTSADAAWTFTYDADGMRTGRTNGTTAYSYIYTGGKLTQMTVGSDTVTFTYDASGNPQTLTYNGTTYYYAVNLQGDVMAILDGNGNELIQYVYRGYGTGHYALIDTTIGATLVSLNPLLYRGYVYDREIGLYYLQSRYYNPRTGRFINADALTSTGQGELGNNMFAYCNNNPIMRTDPTGEAWWLIPALIIPFIISGCTDNQNGPAPRSYLANAPDLNVHTAPNGSYNCYGNAIGKQIVADPTGYNTGDSVEKTFLAVQNDLGGEKNCIRLDSYDSPIEDGWYVVAMMCGETDYHFIRLDENGWYNKSGFDPYVGGCYIPFSMVHTDIWFATGIVDGRLKILNQPGNPVYYNDGGPLYFAVRSGWDD